METITRAAGFLSALTLTAGVAVASATPAEASMASCPAGTVGLYAFPHFGGGVRARHCFEPGSIRGGRNLIGRWDNVANGVVNRTGRTVVLCRYHGARGWCWTVGPHGAADWTGYRRFWDRASWIKLR